MFVNISTNTIKLFTSRGKTFVVQSDKSKKSNNYGLPLDLGGKGKSMKSKPHRIIDL